MKTDIFEENMFVDSDTLNNVNVEETKNLSSLVQQLNDVSSKITKCEEHLKVLKKEKQRLSLETIPELMDEMGIERLDVDGATVTLKPFVSASIPSDRRQEAYTWLRENGLDDIIKNDVILSFSRGEDNVAGSLMGTTTVTSYVESGAGVKAGGRTGMTSLVIGVLFLAC